MVLRADAQRNLERVLDAATEVFTASGPAASIDEVARRAGVGHGTVLRRFPTKDDLIYAVIERRVGEIHALLEAELKADDPGEAFFRTIEEVAAMHMDAPGLHQCVVRCGKPDAAELDVLGEKLVARAQRAGTVRRDVTPRDVLNLVRGALESAPSEHWRAYLAVVLDGLRVRG
jgi:AcrR family transcriptional regulator